LIFAANIGKAQEITGPIIKIEEKGVTAARPAYRQRLVRNAAILSDSGAVYLYYQKTLL
jgi:predicted amidohydrolase